MKTVTKPCYWCGASVTRKRTRQVWGEQRVYCDRVCATNDRKRRIRTGEIWLR